MGSSRVNLKMTHSGNAGVEGGPGRPEGMADGGHRLPPGGRGHAAAVAVGVDAAERAHGVRCVPH